VPRGRIAGVALDYQDNRKGVRWRMGMRADGNGGRRRGIENGRKTEKEKGTEKGQGIENGDVLTSPN